MLPPPLAFQLTYITTYKQVSEHPQHKHILLHQGFLMGFSLTIGIAEGALLQGGNLSGLPALPASASC